MWIPKNYDPFNLEANISGRLWYSSNQRWEPMSTAAMVAGLAAGGAGIASSFMGGDAEIKTEPTMTKLQSLLMRSLMREGLGSLQDYKPYPGATRRLGPTQGEKGVFGAGQGMLSRIQGRQQQGGQGQQGQQRGAGGAGAKPNVDSMAEILEGGFHSMLSKILASLNREKP